MKSVEYPRCAHYVRKSSLIMSPDQVLSRRILVLIISTFLHFKRDQMGLIHHTAQPFLGATVDYENQLSLLLSLLLFFVFLSEPREIHKYIWVCVMVSLWWCFSQDECVVGSPSS